MSTPEAGLSYSLELSFYGPGALWCWYLTILSVIIAPSSPTRPPGSMPKPTFDIICCLLFPCLAAGHLAIQTSRLDPESVGDINQSLWLLNRGGAELVQNMDGNTSQAILALNASLRVCMAFVSGASALLIFRFWASWSLGFRIGVRHPLLLFVGAVPYIWVLSCIAYLGFKWSAIGIAWVLLGLHLLVTYKLLLCCLEIGALGYWVLFVRRYWFCFLAVPLTLYWGWSMWDDRFIFFPDVQVEISALDQIFPFLTGIIAITFSVGKRLLKTEFYRQTRTWIGGFMTRGRSNMGEQEGEELSNSVNTSIVSS
ncbi:hypothetical protein QBC43DRAFT_353823 [Cladorrhinum sp. PSN259]|nr:hypothetical protein QBC43DRAFT_353823 [Cladorrhinum sp. PSN259]